MVGRGGVSRLSLHRVAHARRGAVALMASWRSRTTRARRANGWRRNSAARCRRGRCACETTARRPWDRRQKPCASMSRCRKATAAPVGGHLRQTAAAGRLDVSADRGRHAAGLGGAGARTRHRPGQARSVAESLDRRRGALIGSSEAIRRVRERIERVAATDFTVLIRRRERSRTAPQFY